MIVRESPRKGASNQNPNWPPKSPHEALLSSPSGRKKWQERRQRSSVSPSPVKRRPLSHPQPLARGLQYGAGEDTMMKDVDAGEETEEEDEETLQLKLAQIEARLKLKQLQKARKAREKDSQSSQTGEAEAARPSGVASSFDGAARVRRPEFARPRPRSMLEVPASPTRKHIEPVEQLSPARRLGIDKGIRAQDVSLKRAPSYRGQNVNTTVTSLRQMEPPPPPPPKVKSFSQRIAESRTKDKEREEKQARIGRSRSTGFGLKNIESLRNSFSSPRPSSSHSTATAMSLQDPFGGKSRSFTMGDTRPPPTPGRPSSNLSSYSNSSRPQSSSSFSGRPLSQTAAKYAEISKRDNSSEAASFETFSNLHLKNRTIDHTKLTRVLDGKTIVTIPQLIKSVKAPEYDPPDVENDYVVLGVICYKSNPLTPKNGVRNNTVGNDDKNREGNQAGKFMVIKLTDLKHEMDLFLFDTGFNQFWKLPIGTLVAVLNPDIMPPPQHQRDSGKFSLKLTSSDDTVLEIGTARDLDFCHARKKDGKDCGSWIDGRKTEYCDFHIELQLDKAKRGRMEVNTMSGTGFGRSKAGGSGSGSMFSFRAGAGRGGSQDLKREGRYHDRFLHETMYIAKGTGAAARLLDSDEQGFEGRSSREERHRKRLADQEKERELARRLGEIGGNAGSDYMRLKGSGSSAANTTNLPVRSLPDSAAGNPTASAMDTMGLLNRKAENVSLAPVKRKRVNTGPSASSTSNIASQNTSHSTSRSTSHISNYSAPVGWGGANRRGLLLSPMKNGRMERGQTTLPPLTTRLHFTRPGGLERTESDRSARSEESGTGGDRSPLKKKARLLVPDKGIREPGRDSLAHMDVGMLAAMDEDDDDDLEVI